MLLLDRCMAQKSNLSQTGRKLCWQDETKLVAPRSARSPKWPLVGGGSRLEPWSSRTARWKRSRLFRQARPDRHPFPQRDRRSRLFARAAITQGGLQGAVARLRTLIPDQFPQRAGLRFRRGRMPRRSRGRAPAASRQWLAALGTHELVYQRDYGAQDSIPEQRLAEPPMSEFLRTLPSAQRPFPAKSLRSAWFFCAKRARTHRLHHQFRHRGPGADPCHLSEDLDIEFATLDTGRLFPETYEVWARPKSIWHPHQGLLPDATRFRRWSPTRASTASTMASTCARPAAACARSSRSAERSRRAGWMTGLRGDQSGHRSGRRFVEFDASARPDQGKPAARFHARRCRRLCCEQAVPINPLHDQGFLSDRLRALHPRAPARRARSGPAAGGGKAKTEGMRPACRR